MVRRNPHFANIHPSYLFVEIKKRVAAFKEKNPQARLISLSIGDTSEPIPEHVTGGLADAAKRLGTREGYRGYGSEIGEMPLREKISEHFYGGKISPKEIFLSDGTKCDIGRLQLLFGTDVTLAVQDPTYPAYVDTSIIVGQKKIVRLPCLPENAFFPDLTLIRDVDLVYFCSPNNPTGVAATREQLTHLVDHIRSIGAILIFDAAYSSYITDPTIPRSIYEIPGAEEVAIELSSFSKMIGFTGVRLGWSVIPSTLRYADGSPVINDWTRLMSTFFNGASNISQAGGLATLSEGGLKEMETMIAFYRKNTAYLHEAMLKKGFPVYGGIHAPYLWVSMGKQDSWSLFEEMLQRSHLITTPGVGFGKCGEGYLRLSAYGHREDILEAVERIEKL